MNRHERRARSAKLRSVKRPLPKARADGRPLFYDINAMDSVGCYYCELKGLAGMRYRVNEAFMADPANSPDGSGDLFTVCRGHLPENAVIYNAPTNKCRNKSGTESWMEDNPDMDPNTKIAAMAGVNPHAG